MKLPWQRRKEQEADLEAELQVHLQMVIRERMERGESAAEAERNARRELGNIALIKETTRDVWRWRPLAEIFQDIRYGLRILWKSPVFTFVAVLSLALGIGANTAIFQLMNVILLKNLPVKNPHQLAEVRIDKQREREGSFVGSRPYITYAQWQQIKKNQQVFDGVFAWGMDSFNLNAGGEARYARAIYVSGGYFNVLAVEPVIGRLLNDSDDQPDCGANGAVISYSFWQREYSGKADAVGKKLLLNGNAFEIIGVTPQNFFGVEVGRNFDVAVPLCTEQLMNKEDSFTKSRRTWWLAVIGRLKAGISLEKASAQLSAISSGIFQETLPEDYTAESVKNYLDFKLAAFTAASGVSSLRTKFDNPLWFLFAITALVLLIACGNIANLMLSRASAREREFAIRLALGASRARLIRQLMMESFLLAVIGACCGAWIGFNLSRVLVSLLKTSRGSLYVDLSLDWTVLLFMAALTFISCLIFGLVPALRATASGPGAVLKAASHTATASRERFGLRRTLVVSQVALSLVLLVGALLFVRTFHNLSTLDMGFKQNGLLITQIDLSTLDIPKERQQFAMQEMLTRIRAIPGVNAATITTIVPMSGSGWNQLIITDNEPKAVSNVNRVSEDFFKTMSVPLIAGRDFNEHDTINSPPVAIVNESFTHKFFHGENPLGKTFRFEVGPQKEQKIYQIVGLTKDTKYNELRTDFEPLIYVADAQRKEPTLSGNIIISSQLSLVSLIAAVKSAMAEINPNIVLNFTAFNTQVEDSLRQERLMALLSSFFGVLAVLLANIGLYGVMSYMVTQRRNEIGIRMALGADRSTIIGMVVREAGLLVVCGLFIGTLLALALVKTAKSLLFGLPPHDLVTFVVAIVVLAAVGLLASMLPAQRAARLDPMVVLRHE